MPKLKRQTIFIRAKKPSVIWSYFIMYLFLVCTVLWSLGPVRDMIPAILKDNLTKKYQIQLDGVCERFNEEIAGMPHITEVLSQIQGFEKLKLKRANGESVPSEYAYYLNKLQNQFDNQLTLLRAFDQGFIWFSFSDMCVTRTAAFFSMTSCLDRSIRYQSEADRAALLAAIADPSATFQALPVTRIAMNSYSEEYMAIVARPAYSSMAVCTYISSSRLRALMSVDHYPNRTQLRILSGEDRELYASQDACESDALVLYAAVPSIGGRVEVRIPNAYFTDMAQPVVALSTRHLLIAIAIGLAASALLAMHSARPIRRIAHLFQGQAGVTNEFERVLLGVRASSEEIRALKSQAEKNEQNLRVSMFSRLLYGAVLTDDELAEALRLMPCLDAPYQIALLQVNLLSAASGEDRPNADTISLIAMETLKMCLPEDSLWAQLDKEHVAVKLSPRENEEGEFQSALEALSGSMDRYEIAVKSGVSDIYTGAREIDRAYRQARLRLSFIEKPRPAVDRASSDAFDARMLTRVYSMICAGDRAALAEAMSRIVRGASEGRFGEEEIPEIFMAVRCAIRYALLDVNPEDDCARLPRYSGNLSPILAFEALAAYADNAIAVIGERKTPDDENSVQKIVDFIHREFANPELSAAGIAREFCMSRSQLYSLFQQNSKYGIAELLRNTRMENAYTLLLETNLSVSEIAVRCGIGSANTFCRMFKQHYGVTPNSVRAGGE